MLETKVALHRRYTQHLGQVPKIDVRRGSSEVESERRLPGATSRWNRGKDLSWVPLRIELTVEVSFDHMQGTRFRHGSHLKRWRPDKPPAECTYEQLDVTAPQEIKDIFGRSS